MRKILENLALIHLTNFCKQHKIDCSGTHLIKNGRGFSYSLVKNETPILSVTFHKNSVPTFSTIRR